MKHYHYHNNIRLPRITTVNDKIRELIQFRRSLNNSNEELENKINEELTKLYDLRFNGYGNFNVYAFL